MEVAPGHYGMEMSAVTPRAQGPNGQRWHSGPPPLLLLHHGPQPRVLAHQVSEVLREDKGEHSV